MQQRYRLNLDALADRQPDVAEAVDAAATPGPAGSGQALPAGTAGLNRALPGGAEPATGRDGSPTFRIPSGAADSRAGARPTAGPALPGGAGRWVWFGGSSMPQVSSEELVAGFPTGTGNVILPGILTGLEPIRLAARLAPHTAVFVVERDIQHYRLALRLYDYRCWFASGRLVLLRQSSLEDDLVAFFSRYPGYEMPTRMLTVPQPPAWRVRPTPPVGGLERPATVEGVATGEGPVPPGDARFDPAVPVEAPPAGANDLQRRLEQGGARVVALQAQLLTQRAERIRGRVQRAAHVAGPRTAHAAGLGTESDRFGRSEAARVGHVEPASAGAPGGRTAAPDVVRRHSRAEPGLARRPSRVEPGVARWAVVSVGVGQPVVEQAERVARALDGLGWPYRVSIPDAPERCHTTARIMTVDDAEVDMLLFVNSAPGSLRGLLPDAMPVVSWFLPGVGVPPKIGGPFGPSDLFFGATAGQTAQLVDAGVPPERVLRLEVGADQAVAGGSVPSPAGWPVLGERGRSAKVRPCVGIMADLPDDRPEAAEFTLPSHVSLWKALQKLARKRAGRIQPHELRPVFDDAGKDCGVAITEPSLRAQFLTALQTRILPVALATDTAAALTGEVDLTIWGSNWEGRIEKSSGAVRLGGPLPTGPALAGAFGELDLSPPGVSRSCRWLVLPVPGPGNAQLTLDALAAGVEVAIRAGNASFGQEHPQLADLGPYIHRYRNTEELLKIVRAGIAGPNRAAPGGPRRGQNEPTAAVVVRERHTVGHRLCTILEAVRSGSMPRDSGCEHGSPRTGDAVASGRGAADR